MLDTAFASGNLAWFMNNDESNIIIIIVIIIIIIAYGRIIDTIGIVTDHNQPIYNQSIYRFTINIYGVFYTQVE